MEVIIFYTPLGKSLPPDKIGGGESESLKTKDILLETGFSIILLEKPVRKRVVLSYAIRIVATWAKLLKILIYNRKATLYIKGYYRELMPVELTFVMTAKILGHKTVYQITCGDMVKEYEKKGFLYKSGMLSLLKHSDSILCEGVDYVRFIKEKLGKSSFFYPNYIQDRFIEGGYPQRGRQHCRLVYFGRIVPAKNIEVMIKICRILHGRGLMATLDLIGGCSDGYKTELEDKIRKTGIPDNCIRFWGRKSFGKFFPYLKTCHFFLFPSNEPREGHSNSLTEAMGCGIVPVVSDAGFNRQVVNDDRLIIHVFNAAAYADIIFEIWTNGEWENYSRKMYSRIAENFTDNCARKTLLAAIYR